MIQTNRPLTYTRLTRSAFFPSNFDSFQYLSDEDIVVTPPGLSETRHGLTKSMPTRAGVWEPVLQVNQPGNCNFIAIGVRNWTGISRVFGVRVFFDGASAFTAERISVANSQNIGFTILGHMFFDGSLLKNMAGCLWAPFQKNMTAYVYAEQISNLHIVLASRTYVTL